MGQILLDYKRPDPATWIYMSSFLSIGLFFVFHRFWSIRNLDIVLLILLAPGLLIVHEGYRRQLLQSEALAARQESDSTPARAASSITSIMPIFAVTQLDSNDSNDSPDSGSSGDSNETTTEQTETAADNPDDSQSVATESDANQSGDSEPTDSENASQVELGEPVALPVESNPTPQQLGPTEMRRLGFVCLFVIEALLLLRLMMDSVWTRRPLLDPNLTTGGLCFIGISLFVFMMANVVASTPRIQVTQGPALGPGYAMMNMLPAIPTRPVRDTIGAATPPASSELSPAQTQLSRVAKTLAIIAHLAIVVGIVSIAQRHFSNLKAGVGCATLYLLLPYTAQMTGRVDHALPAALLLWAVLCYRKPFLAGIFLGLAGGLVYYPLFLLPLWISYYWQRGRRSFIVGVALVLFLLVVALWFDKSASLTEHLQRMFGILNPNKEASELRGVWGLGWNPIWRLPVIVAFVLLSCFFAVWPAQKNLGTLLSGSAALMVAAQFWHGYGGGLYIAWFLPLLLLTIFRPNLEDRTAMKVVIGKPGQSGKPGEPRAPSGRGELQTV